MYLGDGGEEGYVGPVEIVVTSSGKPVIIDAVVFPTTWTEPTHASAASLQPVAAGLPVRWAVLDPRSVDASPARDQIRDSHGRFRS